MKVTLIYGSEGSGKSHYVHQLCKNFKDNRKKTMVIVPDQYTHQTELDLISTFGTNGLTKTEVLSFKRLSHRLKLVYGGASVIVMNDDGRALLINRIINTLDKSENTVLLANASKTDICPDIAHIIARFKQYGITPEDLEECRLDSEKYPRIADKLKEITAVYRAYSEMKTVLDGEEYIDAEDDTKNLCNNIEASGFFADMNVFIDGFDDFTKPDLSIVKALIKASESVTISLPIDYTIPKERSMLFSRQIQMKTNLDSLLSDDLRLKPEIICLTDNAFACTEDVKVDERSHKKNTSLEHLSKHIFATRATEAVKTENISIINELSVANESEHTADRILKTVRENNLRFNEIAVVVSDTELYNAPLAKAFEKRNIPYFADSERSVESNVIVRFLVSLVNVVAEKKSVRSILSLLKTGMFVDESNPSLFRYIDTAYLEKYCRRYHVRTLDNEFIYGGEHYDIEKLNALRTKALGFIEPFVEAMKKASTAREMSKTIENYLDEFAIGDIVSAKITSLIESNESETALEYSNIWNVVRDVLVQVNTFLGDTVIPKDEFRDLLQTSFRNININVIPACLDQVTVVPSGRTMAKPIKALFIVGANGMTVGEESGIFTMDELLTLKECNIDIGADKTRRISDEQYYLYKILSKPSEFLFISQVSANATAEIPANNVLLNAVSNALGLKYAENVPETAEEIRRKQIYPLELEDCDNIGSLTDTILFEKTLPSSKNSATVQLLDEWLRLTKGQDYAFLSDVANMGKKYTLATDNIKSGIIKNQDGNFVIDVTKLDVYQKCPYMYFAEKCINPEIDTTEKASTLDIGNITHEMIEGFTNEMRKTGRTDDSLADDYIKTAFDDCISKYESGKMKATGENKYIITRLRNFLHGAFLTMLDRRRTSSTVIFATELEFDDKPKPCVHLPAVHVEIDEKTKFSIKGKIDYAEYLETSSGKYWIVNDYKTGELPDLTANVEKNNLQLPIYMKAVTQSNENALSGGMFFVKINDNYMNQNSNDADKNPFGKAGLIAENEELYKGIDSECKKSPDSSVYDIKKSRSVANVKTLYVLDEATMKNVIDGAVEKAKSIVCDMMAGNITKQPKVDCKYCNYKRFCGYDKNLKKAEKSAEEEA